MKHYDSQCKIAKPRRSAACNALQLGLEERQLLCSQLSPPYSSLLHSIAKQYRDSSLKYCLLNTYTGVS